MKAYRVFEEGKRCKDFGIKGWETDTFSDKRDAEIFAYQWCNNESYWSCAKYAPPMDVGVEYDYSYHEFPVRMKIEEVEV